MRFRQHGGVIPVFNQAGATCYTKNIIGSLIAKKEKDHTHFVIMQEHYRILIFDNELLKVLSALEAVLW